MYRIYLSYIRFFILEKTPDKNLSCAKLYKNSTDTSFQRSDLSTSRQKTNRCPGDITNFTIKTNLKKQENSSWNHFQELLKITFGSKYAFQNYQNYQTK